MEWRPVVGYEGAYAVSDTGEVMNVRTGKTLRPLYNRGDYRRVYLSVGGVARRFSVHVLVTAAFLGPCPSGLQRNHKDGNGANNSVSNLEYVTASQNNLHAYRVLGKVSQQGSQHGCAKLTETHVAAIRQLRREHVPLTKVAALFGVSTATISEVANRRIWTHCP